MQKLILSIGLLLSISFCNAQDVTYEILDEGNNTASDVILPVQDGYMSFNVSVNQKVQFFGFGGGNLRVGAELNKLDKNLKVLSKADLFNGEKKLLPSQFNFFKFGNNNCLLYQDVVDKEVGNIKLMTINESSLQVINDKLVINLAKNNITYDVKKLALGKQRSCNYIISNGKKRLLIYTEPEIEKDDKKIFYISVMDENLKVMMEKKVDLKLISENVKLHAITIDDFGNIYIAYKQYEDGDSKGFEKVDGHRIGAYKNRLMIVKPDGKETFSDIIKLEGHSTKGLDLIYSPKQNKVFIVGSFSLGFDESHLGVFKSEIDIATMKIGPVVTTDFPDDILSVLDKDGFANKDGKKKGLKTSYSPGTVLRGDGTVDVIMLYQYLQTVTSGTKITSTFYEGSFLDVHFVEGKVLFARIPRDIESPSTNAYLGYFPYSPDEKLFLFYNESDKNIERDIAETPKRAIVQHSEVCLVSIDKAGTVKRQIALKGYEAKSIAILSNSFTVFPNTVFIFLQRLSFMNMSTRDTKFARLAIK